MIKWRTLQRLGSPAPGGYACALLCALLCGKANATDVYRSIDANGMARYASSALDPGYTLFLRGETGTPDATASKGARQKPANAIPAELAALLAQLAQKHAIELALVLAIIDVESRFNQQAISRKGAFGLMQLMPATAARYGITNRHDAAANVEAGIRHLKALLTRHEGNIALALAAYNAGEGAVSKHGRRIPPYRETMLYVPAVLSKLQALREAAPPE